MTLANNPLQKQVNHTSDTSIYETLVKQRKQLKLKIKMLSDGGDTPIMRATRKELRECERDLNIIATKLFVPTL